MAARRTDLVALAGVAAVLVAVVLAPTVDRGLTVGMGPDVPVYLWWGRAAAELGTDAVPDRPGTAALLPTIGGTLGVGEVATQAGLQYALAVAVGLGGAALAARTGAGRYTWMLAGVLTGTFATFLAAGYVSNLAMAAPFLGALVVLSFPGLVALGLAIALVGAAGLAHPQFLLVGAVVLTAAAGWAWLTGARDEARRGIVAILGGAAVAAGGLALAAVGGPPIAADTSKDALLRRLGRGDTLRRLYLDRFGANMSRYEPVALLPAAGLGLAPWPRADDQIRRVLGAWLAVTAVGIPLATVTGWFPADRVVTFASCLPVLAALGLSRLGSVERWRPLPQLVAVAAAAAIAWSFASSWNEQRVFVRGPQLRQLVQTGRVAATTTPGTRLLFLVSAHEGEPRLFGLTFTANLARAAVPAERAPDVRVRLDVPEARSADTAVFALSTLSDHDDPTLHEWPGGIRTTVDDPRPLPPGPNELVASSPAGIVGATLGILALLWLAGYGWTRLATGPTLVAWATAPGVGVGALVLASVAVDRVGIGLDGRLGPLIASGLAGLGGYAVSLVRSR